MLKFKKITLEDKEIISERLMNSKHQLCDYSFAEIFIWNSFYSTEYCIADDSIFLRQHDKVHDLTYYYPPIGSLNKETFTMIKEDAKINNQKLILGNADRYCADELIKIAGSDYYLINDRNRANYIYSSSNLAKLSGKKYHTKKNYINRFNNEYANQFEYRRIDKDDIRNIFDFQINWCINNCHESEIGKLSETCAISTALKNYIDLELLGGMLLIDGKIIAYTLAAPVRNDTLVILIEKADNSISGAYQMINYLFVNDYYNKFVYINREEDMGIEGLRKSKLSYKPEYLEESGWLFEK